MKILNFMYQQLNNDNSLFKNDAEKLDENLLDENEDENEESKEEDEELEDFVNEDNLDAFEYDEGEAI